MGGTHLVVEFILREDIRLEVECILLEVIHQEVGCTLLEGIRVGLEGTRLVVEFILREDIHLEVEFTLLEGTRVGLGGTHLGVGCILLEDTRAELRGIRPEVLHLGVRCILLEDIPLGVGYFLLDPGLVWDLVVLHRRRECLSIHLVAEVLVGLLGQGRSTLPVRVSFLLEAVLRGPAVVSILQGLVHQVLMDQAQTDQAQTDQDQMAQDPMVQVRMGQGQMGQVQMVQALMAQAQMDLGRMGRMVLVPMDLARLDQVPMDLVQVGSLGVEAAAKSRRSSPPQNTSAQLRLRLHHAPLHLKPSWQNAWKLLGATLSMEVQIAHYALLARFALSP